MPDEQNTPPAPPAPTAPPAPPAPSTPPAAGELTSDEKLWGLLAHVLALSSLIGVPFGNLIGPAVAYFVQKDKSKFVRFHAVQSFAFQLAVTVAAIILFAPVFLLSVVTGGLVACLIVPLGSLLWLGLLIYVGMMGLKANKGEFCKYPYFGDWACRKVCDEDWKPV